MDSVRWTLARLGFYPLKPLLKSILATLLGNRVSSAFGFLGGGSIFVLLSRLERCWRMGRDLRRQDDAPGLPVRLQIETTDICNLRCKMCAREQLTNMNTGTIGLEKFTEIIDQINPYYVTMNGLGEPLFDRTLFEKLSDLRRRNVYTSMPTNGTFVRGEKRDRLLENLPDLLTLSIDGATRESFEKIRVRARVDRELANFKDLARRRAEGQGREGTVIQGREGTVIRVLFVVQRASLDDHEALFELMKDLPGVEVQLTPVYDFTGEEDEPDEAVPSAEEVRRMHDRLDAIVADTTDPRKLAFLEEWRNLSMTWLEPPPVELSPSTGACTVPWY